MKSTNPKGAGAKPKSADQKKTWFSVGFSGADMAKLKNNSEAKQLIYKLVANHLNSLLK